MVYHKLNQVVSPIVIVVFDVTSLLEKINITLGMWYMVIDGRNVFSVLIKKKYQGQFPFTKTLYYQHLALGLANSSSICHNVDQRKLDHLDIAENITLFFYIDNIL